MVEAPGIESPDTSAAIVEERRGSDADWATEDDAKRREVSASVAPDVDGAIRAAAKLAIDAGDLKRARALLDLLDTTSASWVAPTPTLAWHERRAPRGGRNTG